MIYRQPYSDEYSVKSKCKDVVYPILTLLAGRGLLDYLSSPLSL
jgi:hypothetical protein